MITRAEESQVKALDVKVNSLSNSEEQIAELFAAVDLLDSYTSLRNILTETANSMQARKALVDQLFSSKLSESSKLIIDATVILPWKSGKALADVLEREAVRLCFNLVKKDGRLDQTTTEIAQFGATLLTNSDLAEVLTNKRYDISARKKLVAELVADKVSPLSYRLIERALLGRVRNLIYTIDYYLELAAEIKKRLVAKVTVARPLTTQQIERLDRFLRKQTGTDVDMLFKIDPNILGGMLVLFGDNRIDLTVAGRLKDLQRQLSD